jgi:hypothetical protein
MFFSIDKERPTSMRTGEQHGQGQGLKHLHTLSTTPVPYEFSAPGHDSEVCLLEHVQIAPCFNISHRVYTLTTWYKYYAVLYYPEWYEISSVLSTSSPAGWQRATEMN